MRIVELSHAFECELSCSLDIFKFDMIVDFSFCCLNEQTIVNYNFSVNSFAKNRLKLEWQMVKWLISCQNLAECRVIHSYHLLVGFSSFNLSYNSFSSFPGRLGYLQLATSWLKFQMPPMLPTSLFVYDYVISLRDFVNYHQLSWTIWTQTWKSVIVNESWNCHQLS